MGVDAKFMRKYVTLNTRDLPPIAGQRQAIAIAILDDLCLHLRAQRHQRARAVLFVLSAEERRALLKLL